jgi:hypothetical protein
MKCILQELLDRLPELLEDYGAQPPTPGAHTLTACEQVTRHSKQVLWSEDDVSQHLTSRTAAAEVPAEKPQEDGVAAAPDARMSTADSVAPAHLPVAADHALPATESDAAEAFMRITAPDEPPPAPSQRALSEEAAHSTCPARTQSHAVTKQHNQRHCKRACITLSILAASPGP